MAERKFTALETDALSVMFTGVENLNSVYCAKASLPSNVWGFMVGAYSRSQLTMREKFLETMKLIAKNDEDEYVSNLKTIVK
jgi:hypothetical protein